MKIGDTVRIKPLVWKSFGYSCQGVQAKTIFGYVEVLLRRHYYQKEDHWNLGIANAYGEWDYTEVESKEAGITKAEEWYLEQLKEAVECLPSSTT